MTRTWRKSTLKKDYDVYKAGSEWYSFFVVDDDVALFDGEATILYVDINESHKYVTFGKELTETEYHTIEHNYTKYMSQ